MTIGSGTRTRFASHPVPGDRQIDELFSGFFRDARRNWPDVPIAGRAFPEGRTHRIKVTVGEEPEFDVTFDFACCSSARQAMDIIENVVGELYSRVCDAAERFMDSRSQRELAARIDSGEWWALFEAA